MIFCIEGDREILGLEIYTFKAAGYEVKGFSDSEEFWMSMKTETPQLILLDIMLPKEDGISILKKLKKNSSTADIPVMT